MAELSLKQEHLGVSEENMTIKQRQYLKMKNSIVELSMEEASYAILPTKFQASTFPMKYGDKIGNSRRRER